MYYNSFSLNKINEQPTNIIKILKNYEVSMVETTPGYEKIYKSKVLWAFFF